MSSTLRLTSTTWTEGGDYTPVIPVTYWSFRFMMGLGMFAAAGAGDTVGDGTSYTDRYVY